MPKKMTDEEIGRFVGTSDALESHEHGLPDDDNWFTATLFRTKDGRHFRHVDSAGMMSDKRPNTGEWLTGSEVEDWKSF